MICTQIRSSSINTYELCQHRYFLEYVLGEPSKANIKACKGEVLHKTCEFLAQYKLCQQENRNCFEDDLLGEILVKDCECVDDIVQKVYDYYVENSDYEWGPKDFIDCVQWVRKVLEMNDGYFDPRNRTIVAPEQRFDLEIKKPWAKYHYELPNGEILDGYLHVRGTIDLITQINDSPLVYEIIDYKSGKRKDWKTDKEINEEYLKNAIQPRLYHYTIFHLYKNVDDFIFTYVYMNDGGSYSITFDKNDIAITENIIKKHYTNIVNNVKPKLNLSWKCRFCNHSTTKKNGQSTCEFYRDKIIKNGITKVVDEYADFGSLNKYKGGGRNE